MSISQDSWEYIASGLDLSEKDFKILRSLYKAAIVHTDEMIGELINELEKQNLRNETTVIVAGDHGENIGDHDLMDHQYCLYETLINVPLIISGPNTPTRTVTEVVELRDLYPTILGLAGSEVPNHSGISQNDLLKGDTREAAISEYLAPQPSLNSLIDRFGTIDSDRFLNRTYRSIRTTKWKLIESSDGKFELFDIEEDPQESNECSDSNPDKVNELAVKLDKRVNSPSEGESGEIVANKGVQERLADLGYI